MAMITAKDIPNEPAMAVVVRIFRTVEMQFGRNRGKTYLVPMAYVGASAREVSAEAGNDEIGAAPIVWRFVQGMSGGGDDLASEPAWVEQRIEIPSTIKDAREVLESELGGWDHYDWYVLEREQARIVSE